MADSKKQVVIPPSPRLPTTPVPHPTLPSLPSSSGSLTFTRTGTLRTDTGFVEVHTDYLRARSAQATAMTELLGSREKLALAVARLQSLPLICEHEFIKGKMEREAELTILELKHETLEIQARTVLAAARLQLAAYEPPEPAPPPSSAPTGLTPADVQKIAQIMPDMKPETIEALVLALTGVMAEKNK